MKILSMTATFGCLDGVTLSLSEGINLYALPNESGKSTWAAFVLAMFYGIDTSKRGSKGTLPEKTRYQPWNGKPMSGTLELEHNGKTIVLQRTSQRGRPMSAFRAWDKTTGLDLPELTAEAVHTAGERIRFLENTKMPHYGDTALRFAILMKELPKSPPQ